MSLVERQNAPGEGHTQYGYKEQIKKSGKEHGKDGIFDNALHPHDPCHGRSDKKCADNVTQGRERVVIDEQQRKHERHAYDHFARRRRNPYRFTWAKDQPQAQQNHHRSHKTREKVIPDEKRQSSGI